MNAKNITAQNKKWAENYPTFVRSGNVNPGNGKLRTVGRHGHYWSSSAVSSVSTAYNFHLNPTAVYPSLYFDRYYGFSLRCLQE